MVCDDRQPRTRTQLAYCCNNFNAATAASFNPWRVSDSALWGATPRPADARSSDSETLSPIRSLAGYIIATHESDFSEATVGQKGSISKLGSNRIYRHSC